MFQQSPPKLGNQYEDDRVLRSYLKRVLPADMRREVEPSLSEMGRLAGGELYELQLADRLNEPTLTQWDAWGNRIDKVELTPLWRWAERLSGRAWARGDCLRTEAWEFIASASVRARLSIHAVN